ncbi:MAG: phenylacetate-coenzyme A ligase PaaK-like adenylate-forming protein [Acidimicrobiales bacterium]|jgi:phenylacetate-coenzyme A ligase PaaK-like adenylate-forming protein
MNTIEKLDSVLQYVLHNEYSDFYRILYKNEVKEKSEITSLEMWEKLPFLTKEDLNSNPLYKRIFVSKGHSDVLRSSSGTTGSSVVLTLRNHPMLTKDIFSEAPPLKGVLIVTSSLYTPEDGFRKINPNMLVVVTTLDTLEASIALLKGTQINCISAWVYAVDFIIPLLKKYELHEQIEVIHTFGGKITTNKFNQLKSVFINANFYTTYSCSECHTTTAVSIDSFDSTFGPIFTPTGESYVELIDTETQAVIHDSNKTGEIVLTALQTENSPSPALRFRTGDIAMYTHYENDFVKRNFVIKGRTQFSQIRIPGGHLNIWEMERVIALHDQQIDDDFELHYYAESDDQSTKCELHVLAKKEINEAELTISIMKNLKVSPTLTYYQGFMNGLYPAITCHVVPTLLNTRKKKIKFHKHE